MDIAYQEALKSCLRIKVGAVLIYNGKLISKGHNRYRRGCHSSLNKYRILCA